MNRTTATCIAGMRSKTTSKSRIHFFPRPREAEPFTRRVFVLVLGILAKRLRLRLERNPSIWPHRIMRAGTRCHHLPIPERLQDHIDYRYYESGHMASAHQESLKALHDDVAAFIHSTDHLSK